MGKKASEKINSLMPAALDKDDEFYKAFIADADNDSGALTNEVKDAIEFINYYTRTQKVDNAHTSLLEYIVFIFAGLFRRYDEPDSYLRKRYKALIERKGHLLWNGKKSIKSVFSYFFPEKDINLIERYPVNNLIRNGDFESFESWIFNEADTEFRLIYSRSFEGGSAMYINPQGTNSTGYMEQQIPSVSSGLYEFLFFFSSPKKGIGDVQFSIRNGSEKYWNGTSWVSTVYNFYEKANIDTSGYYKPIQKTVTVSATSSITVRFKNVNGNGVLIDSVRFGKISEPTFRVYITAEPELFFDGTVYADKKYNFSGFKQYYIQSDMDEILQIIKPAGVYAEMTMLSSRLNIPWDRVLLNWETVIKTYWHLLFDGTQNFNHGGYYYVNLYFDGSLNANSEYLFDGIKMIRETRSNDLLAGQPLYFHNRKYTRNSRLRLERQLYFDGRIGANGKFNFTGEVIGIKVGYTVCQITKRITKELIGQSIFDGLWTFNGDLKSDGKFKYYQSDTEIYLVSEKGA